ncbi:MAG: formyltransferase family protein [Bacilli bacterium]
MTIHHANEHYDEGDIVAQCTVSILPQDTPETLAQRVLIREHSFLVETLRSIIAGIILR